MRVYVEDTHKVRAGDPLVDIDPRDYQVAVERARGDLDQAKAVLDVARGDLAVAQARLAQSEATNEKAQRDVERYRELFAGRVISRDEYEEQLKVGQVDAAGVDSDRAAVSVARKTIAERAAAVEAAEAALDQAKLNLSYTHITAPVAARSASEPSITNSRRCLGSSPRVTKSSSNSVTTGAFSVAPSPTPSKCFLPCGSTPPKPPSRDAPRSEYRRYRR
jgi:multidrug efflux pump subunit AcrA (membrane-fusion protein)